MDKEEKLIKPLEEYNVGEDAKDLQGLLTTISLAELASTPDDMLEDELERLKANLNPGNTVHTLLSEHDTVFDFLDKLEKVNQVVQQMESYSKDRDEFDELKNIVKHLFEAEQHHQEKEEELFLEVERRTQVMRMEHEELRTCRNELKKLIELVNEMDFDTFKKRLNVVVKYIMPMLRDHIFKEDIVFYPNALYSVKENTAGIS